MKQSIDLRSAAMAGALVSLILAATAIVASAEHAPAYRSRYVPDYLWDAPRSRDVYHGRQYRKFWREDYRPSVESRCRAFVAVVGDQFASESGAKEEARKAWMQTARWQWGERYMPIDNAEGVTFECGRSSVGSVAGQVFYRCRISARPCRAESQRGDR